MIVNNALKIQSQATQFRIPKQTPSESIIHPQFVVHLLVVCPLPNWYSIMYIQAQSPKLTLDQIMPTLSVTRGAHDTGWTNGRHVGGANQALFSFSQLLIKLHDWKTLGAPLLRGSFVERKKEESL